MKEVQPVIKDKIEVVKQVQQKKSTLVNRVRPGDGHTCFEFDINTHELRKAKIVSNVFMTGSSEGEKAITQKHVNMKDGFIYVTALNAKNAAKKLTNSLGIPYVKVISE